MRFVFGTPRPTIGPRISETKRSTSRTAVAVNVRFLVVDLALTADACWIVIECNDGQDSGYAGAVNLDDERSTPEGWHRVYWPEEAIALLETGNVTHISLDHDLGDDERRGLWSNSVEGHNHIDHDTSESFGQILLALVFAAKRTAPAG